MDERIIKYFSNTLSPEERTSLLKESESNPELREEIISYQNLEALFRITPEENDRETGREIYNRIKRERKRKANRHRFIKLLSYAASICLIVGSTYTLTYKHYLHVTEIKEQTAVIPVQELHVPPGQMARITLPDGTIAWLNANSTLSYPSVFKDARRVSLTGEAYFEVTENKDLSFIVSTEYLEVTALGTEFNVYSYPGADYTSATLIAGSILVNTKGEDHNSIYVKPNEKVIYQNGRLRQEKTFNKDKLLWKEGIYSFRIASLKDIIKQLEQYYNVQIHVTDPSILDYEYTGKFVRSDGIMEILRIISTIHPFKIKRDEEINRITLYK